MRLSRNQTLEPRRFRLADKPEGNFDAIRAAERGIELQDRTAAARDPVVLPPLTAPVDPEGGGARARLDRGQRRMRCDEGDD